MGASLSAAGMDVDARANDDGAQSRRPGGVLPANPPLLMLVGGHALSTFADSLYIVALTVLAYTLTHSATMVALLTGMRLLPYAGFLPVAGALVDRWDRKRLLVAANLGRTACALGLMLVHSPATLAIAFPLTLATAALYSLVHPAVKSVLPALVIDKDLIAANGFMSQMDSLAGIAAPALAGILVVWGHLSLAFAVGAAACVASAAFIMAVHIPSHVSGGSGDDLSLGDLVAGFRFVFRENEGVVAAFTLIQGGIDLGIGAYWTLSVVMAVQVFRLGGQGTGFLESTYEFGALIAGLLIGVVARRLSPGRLFIVGAAASALCGILFGLSPAGIVPFVVMAAWGVAEISVQINGATVIQASTPNDVLGRVFGAFESTSVLCMLLGTAIIGPLIALLGPRGATVALAALGLAILLACVPRLLNLERALGVRMFLRKVPILTTLSRPMLDDVASRLQLEEIPAQATIVRQGEAGDRLYMIKSGLVDVVVDRADGPAVTVATLGMMDYFGEIALLRDVTRTATVRARGPVTVYSLSRDNFQDLMGRSADLRAAMDTVGQARSLDTQIKLRRHR